MIFSFFCKFMKYILNDKKMQYTNNTQMKSLIFERNEKSRKKRKTIDEMGDFKKTLRRLVPNVEAFFFEHRNVFLYRSFSNSAHFFGSTHFFFRVCRHIRHMYHAQCVKANTNEMMSKVLSLSQPAVC